MAVKRLILLPAAAIAGVLMGNSTVAAMQLRPAARFDPRSPADRAFDRGLAWVRAHGIDPCPTADEDFARGCEAGGLGSPAAG